MPGMTERRRQPDAGHKLKDCRKYSHLSCFPSQVFLFFSSLRSPLGSQKLSYWRSIWLIVGVVAAAAAAVAGAAIGARGTIKP